MGRDGDKSCVDGAATWRNNAGMGGRRGNVCVRDEDGEKELSLFSPRRY